MNHAYWFNANDAKDRDLEIIRIKMVPDMMRIFLKENLERSYKIDKLCCTLLIWQASFVSNPFAMKSSALI